MEGNEYIDVLAGIAVNSVGHCHPKVADAIAKQAHELVHISNFYLSEPQVKLSKKLSELSGMERVFLGNSGTEVAEGAIKIARKNAFKNERGGKIITVTKAFHGRTMVALAATGKEAMLKGFDPIPEGFIKVPFNDLDAIKKEISNEIAAIMLEPIQGEGGVNVADPEYITGLRKLCDEEGIALIFDEIQCGMGRTGKWFGHQWYGVKPDIMMLAKALGNGVPIGAILTSEKIGTVMEGGDHGTTFGGNPLVCAAALATISVMEEENLLEAAKEKGQWLVDTIKSRQSAYPEIKEIRGKGLMIGVELNREAKPVVLKMMEHKVLGNATADTVVRWVPPLNIPQEDLEAALNVFFLSLEETR